MRKQDLVRQLLSELWRAGVDSVNGEFVTRNAFVEDGISEIKHLLAIGKAADSMSKAALPKMVSGAKALVITKYGHLDDELKNRSDVTTIESGHPIPDQNSLLAGECALSFVRSIPKTDILVVLISGGASALAESLLDGLDLGMLQELNQELVCGGYSIDQINAVRGVISRIKGGKLLAEFAGKKVHVYAISDVPSDDIALIGSGVASRNPACWPDPNVSDSIRTIMDLSNKRTIAIDYLSEQAYLGRVIASNRIARDAVVAAARESGYRVIQNCGEINKDLHDVAMKITEQLINGDTGIYVWGGEPTIALPENPGRGGRNQHLALELAKRIRGNHHISIIVAGSDGSDGPTDWAGAIVDGDTFESVPDGERSLASADSGRFLESAESLYHSGPTGTNVMDLVIALRSE